MACLRNSAALPMTPSPAIFSQILTSLIQFTRRGYAEETVAAMDREGKDIVDQVFQRTQGILKTRRSILDGP